MTRTPAGHDGDRPLDGTPYTEGELDRALVDALRSDRASIAIRSIGIAVAYVLLALAIHRHQMPAPLVALPWLVEFVAIQWLGLALASGPVDCPGFVASSRRPVLVLLWTLAVILPIGTWLAWDSEAERPNLMLLPVRAVETARVVVDSGLHWAVLAVLLALAVTSIREISQWRSAGRAGAFVWTATFPLAFRFVGGLLLLFVVPFAVPVVSVLFGIVGAGEVLERVLAQPAWLTFAALLAIDLFALVASTRMHRDLAARRTGRNDSPRTPASSAHR